MARQQLKPRQDSHKLSTDPQESAQAAGLRYVSDVQPGIRRQRAGRGFRYIGVDGRPIRDAQSLRRFKALVIPPAWTEVWICPRPDGHIQATGRDTRGRKQYRYHPHWRTVRDTTKYDRMIAFGEALPRLREYVERDMARPGLPLEKVLATVVRLLETTLIRIGNSEYARENQSFGLTTMRDRHVTISGTTLQFQFRGKGGKYHTVSLNDRRLANNVSGARISLDTPCFSTLMRQDSVRPSTRQMSMRTCGTLPARTSPPRICARGLVRCRQPVPSGNWRHLSRRHKPKTTSYTPWTWLPGNWGIRGLSVASAMCIQRSLRRISTGPSSKYSSYIPSRIFAPRSPDCA